MEHQPVTEIIGLFGSCLLYTSAITIEVATGGDTTGSFYAQVWVDGAWTRVEMAQPLRAMGLQYTIIYLDKDTGKGMLYRWYGGNNSVKSWAVDERGADLAQHIPTYCLLYTSRCV